MNKRVTRRPKLKRALLLTPLAFAVSDVMAQALPGGTLDPTTIPKYVTPLVIPPVMNNSGVADDYDIAVRQFPQQILPGGIWATLPGCTGQNCTYPATTVWSYGPAADPTPAVAPDPNSQFNYPAYTVENTSNVQTTVDWANELVAIDPTTGYPYPSGDPARTFLPHITPVDRTLHWANPEQLTCTDPNKTKDCRVDPNQLNFRDRRKLQQPYDGPVPIITHVHGAHVTPESDGYPEAWWLPDASNIPAGYATQGTLVNQYADCTLDPLPPGCTNRVPGIGSFTYPNDQPSTTLWYHDHTLGMTRNNVYAGPAGFWLIREAGGGETGLNENRFTLPGPAPVAGEDLATTNFPAALGGQREKYREIPIVIQDRSFNADGSLFYPGNRAFFEGLGDGQQTGPLANWNAGLRISTIGSALSRFLGADIAPTWNPEAFFNVMVVNGVSWPTLEVEPDLYRFRLLNGCNSRFLNLAMQVVNPDGTLGAEVPFYQIGAEQSLLPRVVQVMTGFKTRLPGNGTIPAPTPAASTDEALLMGLAERADVLVDFSGLAPGTTVRMFNTGPDAPFGGFPALPLADPGTTGQVMEFTVGVDDLAVGEGFTAPADLRLSRPDRLEWRAQATKRNDLALLEEESLTTCATIRPNGTIVQDYLGVPDPLNPGTCKNRFNGTLRTSLPFAPKAAVLGNNGAAGGTVTLWSDPIVTNPALGSTETWELWNWSADAHPIHLHLVKFRVLNRQAFDPLTGALGARRGTELTEKGWKDTVIAYPGEVTRLKATFDIAGLYVWHCHIVEHEDNEMMVPFCVGNGPGCNVVP